MTELVEDRFDQIINNLEEIEKKLEEKVNNKEKLSKISKLKNSHIHIMINTEEKNKLVQKAKDDGLDFSEWCRRKIKEDSQLSRIENKINRLVKHGR